MNPDDEAIAAYTAEFRDATGYEDVLDAFAFGDSPEMAEKLARLVVDGDKRATAGWLADEDAHDLPAPGRHWIVLDGDGRPACVIRTDEVEVAPFGAADPAFAWDEGEGDRTLEDWRDAHLRFFTRRAETVGIPFDDDQPVLFERFSLVRPEPPPRPALVDRDDVTVRPLRPDERPWLRTLLGDGVADDDVVEASGGFPADACPALLARDRGRTAGVLVFRPSPTSTTVVTAAFLTDAPRVEHALHDALGILRDRHRWGAITSG
ncbi:MAG: ASCH domain-containing protein [Actinobacteria bacterium]|nr:ASCH domain-containing protein [Actinomycetota bacterium]